MIKCGAIVLVLCCLALGVRAEDNAQDNEAVVDSFNAASAKNMNPRVFWSHFFVAQDLHLVRPFESLALLDTLFKYCDTRDSHKITYAYFLEGETHRVLVNLDKAAAAYEQSLRLGHKYKDTMAMAYVYNSLGRMTEFEGQFREAIRYYQLSMALDSGKTSDDYGVMLCNIGSAYSELGLYDSAFVCFHDALIFWKKRNSLSAMADGYASMAYLYVKRNEPDSALDFVERGMAVLDTQERVLLHVDLLHYKASALYQKGEYEKAFPLIDRALKLDQSVSSTYFNTDLWTTKAEVLEGLGRWREASEVHKRMHEEGMRVKEEEYQRKLVMWSEQLGYQKKLAESERAAAQKQQAVLKDLHQRKRRNGILLALTVLLACTTLFVWWNRRGIRKQQLMLKKKQVLIEQQNQELKEHGEFREKLVGIIAHDVRGAFSSVIEMLSLVRGDKDISAEERDRLLSMLINSSERSLGKIEGVIEWAKNQLGKRELNLEFLELRELMTNMVTDLQVSFAHKEVQLNIEVADGHMCRADAQLLKVCLRNLLSNALKFSNPGGKVCIKAYKDQQACLIEVSDNGVGMESSTVGQLFTYNMRTHRGTQNERGTGLGLMQVKEFVELMNGSVSVRSTLGEGSVFTLRVPAEGAKFKG